VKNARYSLTNSEIGIVEKDLKEFSFCFSAQSPTRSVVGKNISHFYSGTTTYLRMRVLYPLS
jgi:hypothetical protein